MQYLRTCFVGAAAAASISIASLAAAQPPAPSAPSEASAVQPAGPGQAEELSYYTSRWSDARLKSDIVPLGTGPLGIGVYEYEIFGHREIGVMAQELEQVLPEAVITMPSGYKMVRYDLIPGWDRFMAERAGADQPRLHKTAYIRWSDMRLKSRIVRIGSL